MSTEPVLPTTNQDSYGEALDNAGKSKSDVGFLDRLTPTFIREARQVWKTAGYRGLVKKYGWKLFAVFFIYYLIRDSILYLLLPYLIARGLF